jgi:hypothetical protein
MSPDVPVDPVDLPPDVLEQRALPVLGHALARGGAGEQVQFST